jgi:hypothetical protein
MHRIFVVSTALVVSMALHSSTVVAQEQSDNRHSQPWQTAKPSRPLPDLPPASEYNHPTAQQCRDQAESGITVSDAGSFRHSLPESLHDCLRRARAR